MVYLTIEGIKLLLQQPDTTTSRGRRDLTLLSLMYDTGARVQETIDLTPSMLRLNKPPTIKIVGKGNKARLVPMLDAQIEHLKNQPVLLQIVFKMLNLSIQHRNQSCFVPFADNLNCGWLIKPKH